MNAFAERMRGPASEWTDTIAVRQAPEKGGMALAIGVVPARSFVWSSGGTRLPGANMIGIELASAAMPGLASEGDRQPDAGTEPGECRHHKLVFCLNGGV